MQIGIAKATLQAHMAASFFLWSSRLLAELSRFGTSVWKQSKQNFSLGKITLQTDKTVTRKQI